MVHDEPRSWRNVRIPRPFGFVRVAGGASARQSSVNVCRHVDDVVDRLLRGEWRIRPRHLKELRHHETKHQNQQSPLENFFHGRFPRALLERLPTLPIITPERPLKQSDILDRNDSPLTNSARHAPGLYCQGCARSIPLRGVPPLPPCFAHQYQNKGVKTVDLGINIKTKDLAQMKRMAMQVVCFETLTPTSKIVQFLSLCRRRGSHF